jgi:hypothetical protein
MTKQEIGSESPDLAGPAPTPSEMGMEMQPPASNSVAEDAVPADSLAVPGDDQKMTAPEVGDIVQYTCEGNVTRIEGDRVYVARTAINGTEVTADAPPGEPDGDEAFKELSAMAESMPEV